MDKRSREDIPRFLFIVSRAPLKLDKTVSENDRRWPENHRRRRWMDQDILGGHTATVKNTVYYSVVRTHDRTNSSIIDHLTVTNGMAHGRDATTTTTSGSAACAQTVHVYNLS